MCDNMILIINIIVITRGHLRWASQAGIDQMPWKVFTFFTFMFLTTTQLRDAIKS